jgi:uncharacterized protein YodC (DUF2158 family)
MAFEIGNVVQLKGGGPIMTITGRSVGKTTLFRCTWFDKQGSEQNAAYPAEALKLYREEKAAPPVDDNG